MKRVNQYVKERSSCCALFQNPVLPDEPDVETIRVKVTDLNNKRKYLRLLPLHASQEETERLPDYSVFTYRLYPTYDFFQEVFSQGAEIEVLSPEWVRQECTLLPALQCIVPTRSNLAPENMKYVYEIYS